MSDLGHAIHLLNVACHASEAVLVFGTAVDVDVPVDDALCSSVEIDRFTTGGAWVG